ncbi:sugar-specific transcriptional regulator TrmB [Terracoccus luteus]|uniref:Sugar-specific transcriptional regulator TrmB n=1 Tax=Terracoccus luteus TaxID=53356 RepID=A0A495Y2N1_9MICO|nr:helix-turn-helix domain-containing protein [Terracoccus luteus]RKT78318.1 sugar-specific transcriptional regulator TrmB [Terracoccus luteus]
MLEAIGLDEQEEAVYGLLVTLGSETAGDLGRRLGMPVGEVETALRALERHGLVARPVGRPEPSGGRWMAAPPAVALRALVNERRHGLEQAEVGVARLMAAFRSDAPASELHELVEIIVGAEAVAQRFRQIQLGAVRTVDALVTSTPVAVTGEENDAEETATGRGVRYRVVLERESLEAPGAIATVTWGLGRDTLVRVADRVPTKLLVTDGEAAMVPLLTDGSDPSALFVRASGLLAPLQALFEAVWDAAVPLHLVDGRVVEQPEGPDELDLRILSLLLAGLTDSAVAKALDLGLRTVQRRVSGLLDRAGVTSRLQLGWQARERGWVTRP